MPNLIEMNCTISLILELGLEPHATCKEDNHFMKNEEKYYNMAIHL